MKLIKQCAAACAALSVITASSQTITNVLKPSIGWSSVPADNTPVDLPEYYGAANDFSGGYAIGDTVADFTIYDFDGNALTLSEELAKDKPVLLINGSVSCTRFHRTFDTLNFNQEFITARLYLMQHYADFNWIFIYNMEAHPSSGPCPSNCPAVPTMDTAVVQHTTYLERKWAMKNWLDSDSTFFFPWNMYADNPDNGIYNHFFRRPYGILQLNCEGIVLDRGDWANMWLNTHVPYLDAQLNSPFQLCQQPVSAGKDDLLPNTHLVVYPNPAMGEAFVRTSASGWLQVRDVTGRQIIAGMRMQAGEVFTLTAQRGMYYVTLIHETGHSETQAVVIR